MPKAPRREERRDDALTRDRIIDAALALLDASGEDGLTFRALAERLATGPGALYWHIANKTDLLIAACDSLIARTLESCPVETTPARTLRTVALALFDTIDQHPWLGSVLLQAELHTPVLRILERLGQPVRALGVPTRRQWATVSALMSYILGVAGQNAVNGQYARLHGLNRTGFLGSVAATWAQLDPQLYPFTRSMAGQLVAHDDRKDFLTGLDLLLRGIGSPRHAER